MYHPSCLVNKVGALCARISECGLMHEVNESVADTFAHAMLLIAAFNE